MKKKIVAISIMLIFVATIISGCTLFEESASDIIEKNNKAQEDVKTFHIERVVALDEEWEDDDYNTRKSISQSTINLDATRDEGKGVYEVHDIDGVNAEPFNEAWAIYYDLKNGTMYAKQGDTNLYSKNKNAFGIDKVQSLLNDIQEYYHEYAEVHKDEYDKIISLNINDLDEPLETLGLESDVMGLEGNQDTYEDEDVDVHDGTLNIYFDAKDNLLKKIEIKNVKVESMYKSGELNAIYQYSEYNKINPKDCLIPAGIKEGLYDYESIL